MNHKETGHVPSLLDLDWHLTARQAGDLAWLALTVGQTVGIT